MNNLELMNPVTLVSSLAAPSWVEDDVLAAATEMAEQAGVTGSVALVDDNVHLEFYARLTSRSADAPVVVTYALPIIARGVSTDRVHTSAEVLSELAFAASADAFAAEGLARLVGKRSARVLTRLADDEEF